MLESSSPFLFRTLCTENRFISAVKNFRLEKIGQAGSEHGFPAARGNKIVRSLKQGTFFQCLSGLKNHVAVASLMLL